MSDSLMDTVFCLFNRGEPGVNDPRYDCTDMARWHIQYRDKTHTQSCDGHLGWALRWRESEFMHEFSAACNLPGSWYDMEMGACYTEELGLELGLLIPEKGKTVGYHNDLRGVVNVQGRDGNWDFSAYMRGMYNGLELALAMFEEREPSYKDAPEGGYISDRPDDKTDSNMFEVEEARGEG